MKKIFVFASIFTALITSSCTSKFENSISEYMQKMHGMDAKIYDLKEVKQITVADSMQILKKQAQQDLQNQIDSVQRRVDKYKSELSDGAKIILNSPTLRDAYATVITRGEKSLDSLRNVKLPVSEVYSGRDENEVLALIYSGRMQSKKAGLTYFVLSPDGKICLSSMNDLNK